MVSKATPKAAPKRSYAIILKGGTHIRDLIALKDTTRGARELKTLLDGAATHRKYEIVGIDEAKALDALKNAALGRKLPLIAPRAKKSTG